MKVYLCGAINGCTDTEARDWRQAVTRRFARCDTIVHTVDPMRRDYRGREYEAYREVVELDKLDVRRCDVVLVNYVKPSVGTSMEMLYAWTLGIPVVLWCAPGAILSPWLRYHSTCIVHSLEQAIAKILDDLS